MSLRENRGDATALVWAASGRKKSFTDLCDPDDDDEQEAFVLEGEEDEERRCPLCGGARDADAAIGVEGERDCRVFVVPPAFVVITK